jgi:lipopolysaccharide transport system permease protein
MPESAIQHHTTRRSGFPSALGILRSVLGRNRELVIELSRRELADRYIGSALGGGWAVLAPLLTMGVYVFLFGVVFPARFGVDGSPWLGAALVLAGLPPWLALVEVLTRAPGVFLANRSLVRQVVFPTEVLAARTVAATTVAWAVGSAVSLAIALVSHGFSATMLLLPVLWALQLAAMLGLSLLLLPIGAWLRDTREVMAFVATIGLFLTPILFMPATLESFPKAAQVVIELNPASHMVHAYRDALVAGRFEHPWSWAIFAATALVLLELGAFVFARAKQGVAEAL